MATITGSANIRLADGIYSAIPGKFLTNDTILPGTCCYITGSYAAPCQSISGSAASAPMGFAPEKRVAGQPVSLYGDNTEFTLGDDYADLTPGAVLYLGVAANTLDTSPTAGDRKGVAVALTTKKFVVRRIDGFKWFTNAI